MATGSPSAWVFARPTFPQCSPTPTTTSSSVALRVKKQGFLPLSSRFHIPTRRKSRYAPAVVAVQSNIMRVIQTVWKVGKDGIDAGMSVVPISVPRPIARVSVTLALLSVSFFVLKSFLSTLFFALATMLLVYLIFITFDKDEGPKKGKDSDASTLSSEEDAVEEARRIMEKYNK